MVTVLLWVGIVLAIVVMVAGVLACLLGLPGSVAVLVVSFALSASTQWERPPAWMLLLFLALTVLAETGDNALSAWGTKRYGGSARGAVWALIGGLLGAVLFGWVGPLIGGLGGPVGSVIGAVIAPLAGGMLGGYLGGYWYELRQGRPDEEARRAGWGAFLGRAAGSLLKTVIAAVMAGLTLWMLFRAGGPFGE
ncbi:MAG: DUF456 domain-containing protein [Armatimonadetes bacterium]|nr:DUF456 domain-containing protein [Armatimonadota bacterium]